MLNETTTKLFVAVGSVSTGSIAKDAINQKATDKVVEALAKQAPEALIEVQNAVVASNGIDWLMWSQIAGICGVAAMVLRFAFEIFFKMMYERPNRKNRRKTDEKN